MEVDVVTCKQANMVRCSPGTDKLVVKSLREPHLDSVCFDKLIGECVSFECSFPAQGKSALTWSVKRPVTGLFSRAIYVSASLTDWIWLWLSEMTGWWKFGAVADAGDCCRLFTVFTSSRFIRSDSGPRWPPSPHLSPTRHMFWNDCRTSRTLSHTVNLRELNARVAMSRACLVKNDDISPSSSSAPAQSSIR